MNAGCLLKQYDRAPVKFWDAESTSGQTLILYIFFLFLEMFWQFSEAPHCRNILCKRRIGSFATAFIDEFYYISPLLPVE